MKGVIKRFVGSIFHLSNGLAQMTDWTEFCKDNPSLIKNWIEKKRGGESWEQFNKCSY